MSNGNPFFNSNPQIHFPNLNSIPKSSFQAARASNPPSKSNAQIPNRAPNLNLHNDIKHQVYVKSLLSQINYPNEGTFLFQKATCGAQSSVQYLSKPIHP